MHTKGEFNVSPSMSSKPASRLANAAVRCLAALGVVVAGLASLIGSGGGGGGGGSEPSGPPVTLSGTVDFESIPADTVTNGRLLYANMVVKPIRGATIEVLPAAGGAVLASATSSATGAYSVTIPGSQ